MPHLVPLQLLPSGHRARIDQFVGHADEVHRLHELGMRVGCDIEMIRSGSPCIVKIGGSRLAFRNDEACKILVRIGEAA